MVPAWFLQCQEKAANIALNKLSGEFELPQLKDLIEELDTGEIDLDVIGFGDDELAELMEQTKPEENLSKEGSGEKCEACGRPL